jgi:hypothetical protein
LEDENPIFKQPYRLSEMERALDKIRTSKVLDVSLVELLKGEYALATMTLTKKDIFGNWTK